MAKLGKIQKVRYGMGGYQDAQFGLAVTLGGDGWGVCDFWGFWATCIEVSESTQWTEESRTKHYGEVARRVCELLRSAKVDDVARLEGIPVEVTFNGNCLSSWRVLSEVL